MPFSQATITRVDPPILRRDGLHVSWASTAPAGARYQVYLGGRLAAATKAQRCVLPAPSADVRLDIGTVGAGEQWADFSASLPAAPSRRARIAWQGGTFLDPSGRGDVAGFRVFGSTGPAGWGTGGYGSGGYGAGESAVVYAAPLATIPAYTARPTDGWAMGGYGAGAYGRAGGSYSWQSGPLASGAWTFAVAATDAAGNLGTVVTADIALSLPPRPPGAGLAGPRLTASLLGYGVGPYGGDGYGAVGYGVGPYGGGAGYGMPVASLTWPPSPG